MCGGKMRKLLVLVSAVILAASAQICAEDGLKPTQNVNGIHEYTAKNFDFLIGKVNGIQDDLLKMHMKLYQGYVTNTNLILSKIRELDAKNENKSPLYAGLKRMLGWEFDGMLLHEYYFESLGGGGMTLDTSSPLFAKIQADYGSFDAWKADFIATGLMRGIGWVIAYVDPKDGRVTNVWINEHDVGHLAGGTPLLVMDVFEHAYITQFGLDRGKYIDVFFNNINWKKVSECYNSLKK
jgi:Fe-Mn family superoxide dismutase